MTKYDFVSIEEMIVCDIQSYYNFMNLTLVNLSHELAQIMTIYDFSRISEINFSDIRTDSNFI